MWSWFYCFPFIDKDSGILKSKFILFYLFVMIRLESEHFERKHMVFSFISLYPKLNVKEKIFNAFFQVKAIQPLGHFWILSVPLLTTSEVEWLIWLVNLERLNWTCLNSLSLVFFSPPTDTRSNSFLLSVFIYMGVCLSLTLSWHKG